ncbi:hypothetical protein E8E14_004380 [Neopestalotiopsis sp. 37M]|nr:hypothetical protein E8E14_004380 [Neopestalotiopsis sp. 37M]
MDPLSALGLTSGIVQLIDFTTSLIRTGVEIHGSLDGATLDNQNLEQVCERMNSVLETVKDPSPSEPEPGLLKWKANVEEGSLKSLCERCRSDCKEILAVLKELKTKNGGRKRWGAMASAFKSLMKQKKLQDIEARLDRTQRALSLHLSIIMSLRFRELPMRLQAITDAHRGTFEWIYNKGHFRTWLESGKGIFWISGKPGAGKSTLMKYIDNNSRTQGYLDNWAAPSKAIIVAHYFWNMGTPLQKSLQGLLQTIIFHILRQIPDAIPMADPSLWRSAIENYSNVERHTQWSMESLSSAIERIAQNGDLGVRICLFIDGLDEFEGDHLEVCNHLISLAESPNIKICLSSRPWNAFIDKFGGNRDLCLAVHELTGDDIKRFANEQLQSHPLWNNTTTAAEEKQSLVEEIRTRANGVFLWVALVTKSLCDGLTNRDTIYDLRRRLELLPVDLENLFRLILERVDPAYSQKSAESLLIALHQNHSLPVAAFLYHEKDHENGNYAISWPTRQVSGAELDEIQDYTGRRISALTGGLLEIHRSHTAERDESYVDFLHRSVAEFLCTKEISKYLQAKMRPNFDVYMALVKLLLVSLKTGSLGYRTDEDSLQYAFDFAKKTRKNNFSTVSNLLDAMEITLVEFDSSGSHRSGWEISARETFRQRMLESFFTEYASRRLFQDRSFLARLHVAPMETVLKRCGPLPPVQMIGVLQQFGYDLNESIDEAESPWSRYFRLIEPKDLENYLHAFQKLIQLGADPNANMHHSRCDQSVFSAFLSLTFSDHILAIDLSSYLSTLDVFLDYGADFSRRIGHRQEYAMGGWYCWPDQVDSGYDTLAKVFHRALSLVRSGDRIKSNQEIVFEATKRLLAKYASDPALTSGLHRIITDAFPQSMALILCSMLSEEESEDRRQQPKKRKRASEMSSP